jgi:hypothetical protein
LRAFAGFFTVPPVDGVHVHPAWSMERAEVEVFSQQTNAWVIRTPGRQYPAMVVQGDSFSSYFTLAQSILDRARTGGDEELTGLAEELRDLVWGRLQHYEAVLHQHGLDLPYNRVAWPE